MNSCTIITLNGVQYSENTLDSFVKSAASAEEYKMYKEVVNFLFTWFDKESYIVVKTSGSTGVPKSIKVKKEHMYNSAKLTCSFFGIKKSTKMLLCMSSNYIAGKMMLVRALFSGADLYVRVPSGRPFKDFAETIDFTALVPLQVYNSLSNEPDRCRLSKVSKVLIGGGAITDDIQQELNHFKNEYYSSYGMTETVSHIAIRALNGESKSIWYAPLPNVNVSKTSDGTLCIDAPLVSDKILVTNDIVNILEDGRFQVLGRLDNVINSGGVKLQIEKIEHSLRSLISVPYVITSRSDGKLGSAVTLLIEGDDETLIPTKADLSRVLSGYEMPKSIYLVSRIPLTKTQKIQREACCRLAEELYKQKNN